MATRHEVLFQRYVEALSDARQAAQQWWDALQRREELRLGDAAEARRRIRQRWPCGAAAHPRVIAVLRDYFFACLALNEQLAAQPVPGEEEVYPQTFLTEWLLDGRHDHLALFLADLSYWPIGMDFDGNYT